MEISSDVRARIIDAAEQLFEEAGRERFPPIDQVRRLARVGMNDASTVMKEWRRQQTSAPRSIAVEVPDRIKEVFHGALAEAWQEAQDLANESLTAAQQAWESERSEADSLRRELSDAYEAQADELEEVQKQLAAALERAEGAEKATTEVENKLVEAREQIHVLQGRWDDAERRDKDKADRIAELKRELADDRQQAERAAERHDAELGELRTKLEDARSELVRVQSRAEADADAAKQREQEAEARASALRAELDKTREQHAAAQERADAAVSEARERAATLSGRLEAATEQNRELMAAFGSQVKKKPSPARKKSASKDHGDETP